MKHGILCGVVALVAMVAGAMPADAQLFNSNRKGSDSSSSGQVYNNSGKSAPAYIGGATGGSAQQKRIPNQGLDHNTPRGKSKQSKIIEDAASERILSARAAVAEDRARQEAIFAEGAARSQAELNGRPDRQFGTVYDQMVEQDGRRQVFDKHRDRNPVDAPRRLFNSVQ